MHNGSRWVHTDAVIHVPTKINTHFVTTLPNPKVYAPITVSLSMTLSDLLVSINEHAIQTRSTCHELFRPYMHSQKRDIFHPSAVGVCLLIHRKLLSGIFPKRNGQWWCW